MIWSSHQDVQVEVAMAINNVKDFIYEFTRKRHFDQMPAETRARYDEYKKNKDFNGNMKFWVRDLDGQPAPVLDSSKYEDLYKLFQDAFEKMSQNKKKFKDKGATKKFFEEWFGDGKLFKPKQFSTEVKDKISDFVTNVLDNPARTQLADVLKTHLDLSDYGTFVNQVRRGDYETDPDVRSTLFKVLRYVHTYSDPMAYGGTVDPTYWPPAIARYDITAAVPPSTTTFDSNPEKWLTTVYNPAFRFAMPHLLEQLVDSPSLLKDFKEFSGDSTISGQIEKGIEDTNYSDSKSPDYVPPKVEDKKNIFERFDDAVHTFKENTIDPWTNILRGTRRYFSPYSKTILEAMSKVKDKDGKPLKPTDGLQGILANKDAILKKVELSPTAKKHFTWFTEKMDLYSKTMPSAFAGALHNPRKLRQIVSQIIYDALADGKSDVDQAKTALEILSTMKYGIAHSRLADAMKKEEFVWLSHKDLSWNKYEGVQFVTKALDKATKYAVIGAIRVGAAIRNKWMRDHTKLKNKHRRSDALNKAHSDFATKSRRDKTNAETHSSIVLNELALGHGEYTLPIANDADLANAKTVVLPTLVGTPDYDKLQNDIMMYEQAKIEQGRVATWEADHQDKYAELMAFWDMLESFGKSHQLTFAAGQMRKNFLKGYDRGTSRAQVMPVDFLSKRQRRYAA